MRQTARADAAYTGADHEFRDADPYAKAKYDLTLRWLRRDLAPGRLVYNIGCGAGYFNMLAARRGARVVACEPDPGAYASAAPHDMVTVLNYGLEEFAVDREPADVVVMHDVLEHIEDDRAAAATLAGLVRKDGVAVVSVPALQSLFGLHDELLGHFRRYDARGLRSILQPHFRIERLQYYGMFSIPIVVWFSRWRRTAYPLAAGSSGATGRAYAALCELESHMAEPIGTSILALVRPIDGNG